MIKWIHHLINPHCEFCREEKVCTSCETLRSILEQERYEKKQLLELIIKRNEPEKEAEIQKELKPINPKYVPWRIQQQMLEEEDRQKARILRESTKQNERIKTDDLEKELLKVEKERENAS